MIPYGNDYLDFQSQYQGRRQNNSWQRGKFAATPVKPYKPRYRVGMKKGTEKGVFVWAWRAGRGWEMKLTAWPVMEGEKTANGTTKKTVVQNSRDVVYRVFNVRIEVYRSGNPIPQILWATGFMNVNNTLTIPRYKMVVIQQGADSQTGKWFGVIRGKKK